jgi:hypothetical protein
VANLVDYHGVVVRIRLSYGLEIIRQYEFTRILCENLLISYIDSISVRISFIAISIECFEFVSFLIW